jgi:hypothetical protein
VARRRTDKLKLELQRRLVRIHQQARELGRRDKKSRFARLFFLPKPVENKSGFWRRILVVFRARKLLNPLILFAIIPIVTFLQKLLECHNI